MREIIARPLYLNRFIEYKDIDLVKVITGMRRCGKSTMLDLFHKFLSSDGVAKENIIHLNLESLKYRDIRTFEEFYAYIAQRIKPGARSYLLFDELQEVEGWERAVESLRLDFDVDIYITGSNAYFLSTEFSTLLSGRYIEIHVMPLSFKEFLSFYDFAPEISLERRFEKYLQIGGMPVLRQFGAENIENCMNALEGIYSTVLVKDVLRRSQSADSALLWRLARFLCDSIGSLVSPNSIGGVFQSEGLKSAKNGTVSSRTVEKYLQMLEEAFLFYPAQRFDIKGKQLLRTLAKHYVCDLGFRNMLLGFRDTDKGGMLENVVYLELLRRGYKVYVGKAGEQEIDFVAEKPNEKLYIQVSATIASESTMEREFRPLVSVRDNYEKIILTLDRNYIQSKDGIKLLNIIDWLLE